MDGRGGGGGETDSVAGEMALETGGYCGETDSVAGEMALETDGKRVGLHRKGTEGRMMLGRLNLKNSSHT